ncbi:MAG: murein L,D-transpeptidase catalytic domain family protein [Chlorobiaceae bacterium]
MIRLIVAFFMMLMLIGPMEGPSLTNDPDPFNKTLFFLSQSSELTSRIDQQVLSLALAGYYALKQQGKVTRDDILTVVDFSKPSVDERLFVIDINNGCLLYSGLVAHGSGSGDNYAERFSNALGSYKSSLGFFTTGNSYDGKHGYSLRLLGMERGINDNAEMRSIVIHGAEYVSSDFIRKNGRLGRSQGCLALSFQENQQVINLIKGGSCLFIYQESREYALTSTFLNPDLARLQYVSTPFL